MLNTPLGGGFPPVPPLPSLSNLPPISGPDDFRLKMAAAAANQPESNDDQDSLPVAASCHEAEQIPPMMQQNSEAEQRGTRGSKVKKKPLGNSTDIHHDSDRDKLLYRR